MVKESLPIQPPFRSAPAYVLPDGSLIAHEVLGEQMDLRPVIEVDMGPPRGDPFCHRLVGGNTHVDVGAAARHLERRVRLSSIQRE